MITLNSVWHEWLEDCCTGSIWMLIEGHYNVISMVAKWEISEDSHRNARTMKAPFGNQRAFHLAELHWYI